MELRSIEDLIDRLSEKIETLIKERDGLKQKVDHLNAYAAERDEECVRARQEMARALEDGIEEAIRLDRSGSEIEVKLQNLNDRLVALATGQRWR